jgi:putative heme-binding domain-containing protein
MKAKQIVRRNADLHASDSKRAALWLKAMAATATPPELPYIFERAGNDPEVLAALKCAAPAQAEFMLEPLLNSHIEALREQGLRLAGQWRVKAFEERVRSIAFDQTTVSGVREAAISALSNPDDLKKLAQDPTIGRIALHTLVGNSPGIAAKFVLSHVNQAQTPEAAAMLLGPLLERSEGLPALISALGQPDALSAAGARAAMKALNNLGRSDARISQPLMKLAGINASLPAYTREYVSSIAKSAVSFGSAIEGKKIYEQAGCVSCHVPGPGGSKIGPDLSSISRGMPIDMIIAEVVWPALNVKEGYEAATVTMKDGSVVSGFKHTDTADSITVREMSSGELRSIRKSDARAVQVGGTVMPDGLTAGMSEQQLAHLVRYLSELGQ